MAWACIGSYVGAQIGGGITDSLAAAESAAVLRWVGLIVGGLAGLVAGVWNGRKNPGGGRWEIGLALVGALAGLIGGVFLGRVTRSLAQGLQTMGAGLLNGGAGGAIAGTLVALWQRYEKDDAE